MKIKMINIKFLKITNPYSKIERKNLKKWSNLCRENYTKKCFWDAGNYDNLIFSRITSVETCLKYCLENEKLTEQDKISVKKY